MPEPKAREVLLLPPMPMAMPLLLMRNVIGMTTVMARMAKGSTQRPTKIVPTIMESDMTRMPMEAGTVCFTSSRLMEAVPSSEERLMGAVAGADAQMGRKGAEVKRASPTHGVLSSAA